MIFPAYFPTIETDRLLLRKPTDADEEQIVTLIGDRDVADTLLVVPHPYNANHAREWFQVVDRRFNDKSGLNFLILLRSTAELIGGTGLSIQHDYDRAAIGYWIGRPYWNSGYATEAVTAVLKYCFERLQVNRIYASHFARNPASGRVMQKSGMRYEGTFQQHYRKGDKFEDAIFFGITRQDWNNKKINDDSGTN